MRGWLGALILALAAGLPDPAQAQPIGWLALGGQAAVDAGRLGDTVGVEGSGLLAVGWHLLNLDGFLLGPEAEGSGGRLDADLGTVSDGVTVWRGRVGVRLTWWGEDDDPWLVPYVRAGAVYRADRGRLIEDEGFGWYAGVGLDVRLTEHWSVGPFVTYEAVSLSIDSETVLVGLALTFSY